MAKSSRFISNKVLFAKEIFLASSNSRVNKSSILAKISKFLFVLIIADKETIKSSLSVKESRIFLTTTIFNSDDITIVDLIKSFKSFSSLIILLLSLDDIFNKVISSIEDSKAISAR